MSDKTYPTSPDVDDAVAGSTGSNVVLLIPHPSSDSRDPLVSILFCDILQVHSKVYQLTRTLCLELAYEQESLDRCNVMLCHICWSSWQSCSTVDSKGAIETIRCFNH